MFAFTCFHHAINERAPATSGRSPWDPEAAGRDSSYPFPVKRSADQLPIPFTAIYLMERVMRKAEQGQQSTVAARRTAGRLSSRVQVGSGGQESVRFGLPVAILTFTHFAEPLILLCCLLSYHSCTVGGMDKKRVHYVEGGQCGNREHKINNLIRNMN
eukprot:scaffold172048_cov21-Tisochrysis_lutea.AAC.1